jgi:small subunit ribosomal protein S1
VCRTFALTKDKQEWEWMRQMFDEASNQCRTTPMEDVSLSLEDLDNADH